MENWKNGKRLHFAIFILFVFPIYIFYSSSTKLRSKNMLLHSSNVYDHSVSNPSSLLRRNSVFISTEPPVDPCSGKYVYIQNIPSAFNTDLLKQCQKLNQLEYSCRDLSNGGLGPKLKNMKGIITDEGWFATKQFTLEVIFHTRMSHYKCLTNNSCLATAIYVPFYAGIDVSRYLCGQQCGFSTSIRDYTSQSLLKWLRTRREWQVLGGRDHFIVSGRITWDLRRTTNNDSDFGNNLMVTPEAQNMTMLVVESSPWASNDFAIPYPSYFHPSTDDEVFQWQNRMRRQEKKKYLFCFAGAPRPTQVNSIRNQIIKQCRGSKKKCKLFECGKGNKKCYSSLDVMEMFQNSIFCLQPPGDSATRRSSFDSILAGCIPVFFQSESFYHQYTWHIPRDHTNYSVFIPFDDVKKGKANIEAILNRISDEEVKTKREEVIRLIPKLIYAQPGAMMETVEDAFDLALKRVIERVSEVKKEMKER